MPEDRRFIVAKGDPGFSPERNKKTIERSIQKYEAMRRRKMSEWQDQIGERAHAVASYLKSNAAESNKPIEKYISKRELAYLQGQKIVQVMQNGVRKLVEVDRTW